MFLQKRQFSWQNLPSSLEDDIQTCIKTRQPTNVALGVEGSYVVLYSDSTVTFGLRKQYPLVETLLRDVPEVSRRRGVTYLALNTFVAGEFYVVYGDASTSKSIQRIASADLASAPGGTAPKVGPVEVSLGGTSGKIQVQEVSPPPTYAAQAQTSAAPAQRPAASALRQAAPPTAEKFNWKQGLELGLQAAERISEIINAFEGENGDEQQERESYDQVVFQETVYADGTVVDTATYWESNQ
ncbi:hypothetical protein C8J57DRAFT_1537669 [Mycena rebaudengoi]|nr:hypothetical protein C8J57DRAFT_1537669 [Mycena rebaudengoi]